MKKEHYDVHFEDEMVFYKLKYMSKILDVPIDTIIENAVIVYVRVTEHAIKRADKVANERNKEVLKMMIR